MQTPLFVAVVAMSFACAASAAPLELDDIVAVCASVSMAEATARADALAWRPVPDADLDDWRQGFAAHDARAVVVRAWRQSEHDDADRLSFWIAAGPGGHVACSFDTASAEDLLDRVTARFGTPTTLERHTSGVTAMWSHAGGQVSYSQVGTHAGLVLSRPAP